VEDPSTFHFSHWFTCEDHIIRGLTLLRLVHQTNPSADISESRTLYEKIAINHTLRKEETKYHNLAFFLIKDQVITNEL
jgi:hypothetical protein